MRRTSPDPGGRWLDLLDPLRFARFLLRPRVRLVLAWIVAGLVAWNSMSYGWSCMAMPTRRGPDVTPDKYFAIRRDGNSAHVNIDFSGQYLLGRMVLKGEGPYLYHRQHQIPILQEVYPEARLFPPVLAGIGGPGYYGWRDAFPESGEDPDKDSHDWHDIEQWMIGQNEADGDLGGPLYPPVHALMLAPLTLLPPLTAYRTVQVITILLTFLVAFLAELITEGRVWSPVALVLLLFLPGYQGALGLGQNPLFTLALLTAGWWLVTTNRPILGGIVWGILAYKPVWAVAFLPVLLLTGRWKASAAMICTGVALGLATLPVVGWQCWIDWFHMGQIASDRYSWDQNWLILSRDLLNLPRRPFIEHGSDFQPIYPYGKLLPDVLSYSLWTGVMAVTLMVALLRRRQVSAVGGPGPAFLLFAGWMSCLHFMYYDMMLTFLPLVVLFSEPRRFLQVRFWPWPWKSLSAEARAYYQPTPLEPPPPLPLLAGGRTPRWVVNPLAPLLLLVMLTSVPLMIWYDPGYHFPPMDTFCILALWAWCGWTVWHERAKETEREEAYLSPLEEPRTQ